MAFMISANRGGEDRERRAGVRGRGHVPGGGRTFRMPRHSSSKHHLDSSVSVTAATFERAPTALRLQRATRCSDGDDLARTARLLAHASERIFKSRCHISFEY
eukprot:6175444-Pleurochrysis_carterae.AAC.2